MSAAERVSSISVNVFNLFFKAQAESQKRFLNILLYRLCKLAYGGHIELNQEIVLRASTTGVVLLLYKVLLIFV